MCGRYALALRPSQVQELLHEDDMPVADAPDDEGDGSPRQSYNFAPGYYGLVYRADTPDWGAGPRRESEAIPAEPTADQPDSSITTGHVNYKLQSMKWGLIPFWSKRNPDYSSIMRTINCRDDSLSTPGGMWATMKARKRCIVIAQGFFEWLKIGPKEKQPHYVKRKDGRLMCLAGLWDCVQYDDSKEKVYTYTIITTDSNKQLKFLHDRMPVILEPGSDALRTWLDPSLHEWSRDLQSLLKPFRGEIEVYPVNKDVGKVGNNSPSFLIPLDSKENKSNIANFFANTSQKPAVAENSQLASPPKAREAKGTPKPGSELVDDTYFASPERLSGAKRKAADALGETSLPSKKTTSATADQHRKKKISATKNEVKSPNKDQAPGTKKITSFFKNRA